MANYFKYKAIESTGVTSGVIKLPYSDELSVISYLERQDKTPIYVKKVHKLVSFLWHLLRFRMSKKIKRPFQIEFLGNVSLMLRSGVPLTNALKETAGSAENASFAEDIDELIQGIQGGNSFSQAAAKYPHIFPETIVHLIRLGEETGQLERVLMDGSKHLKRIQTIINDTKQALLYPSFVFVAMGGGMLFWFYYVVPRIVSLFSEMDVALPPLTIFLIQVSKFVQNYVIEILICLFLAITLVATSYKKSTNLRWGMETLLLKLPVSKTIVSASTMAFVSEYFSLLLNVGIDIMKALGILGDTIKNEVYRRKLDEVREGLNSGDGIAQAFGRATIFPSFVVRMIHVGEQSGTLPEQLDFIAEDYREKLSILVATLGKIIEPIVLVFAGAMFAIIIGGLFLPIYDLVSQLSSG